MMSAESLFVGLTCEFGTPVIIRKFFASGNIDLSITDWQLKNSCIRATLDQPFCKPTKSFLGQVTSRLGGDQDLLRNIQGAIQYVHGVDMAHSLREDIVES
jgi:hypothetical protein